MGNYPPNNYPPVNGLDLNASAKTREPSEALPVAATPVAADVVRQFPPAATQRSQADPGYPSLIRVSLLSSFREDCHCQLLRLPARIVRKLKNIAPQPPRPNADPAEAYHSLPVHTRNFSPDLHLLTSTTWRWTFHSLLPTLFRCLLVLLECSIA